MCTLLGFVMMSNWPGSVCVNDLESDSSLLREREMFYLTTHSTHFIYGYMASDIWLRTILIVRKETRCRHIGYSNQLEQGFFYMHHPTDRITHTTAFVTPVVEHWLEREIGQWVHPMKDWSDDPPQHDRTLLPWSYISLPQSLEVLKSSTLTQLTREVMCVATVRVTITPHTWSHERCDIKVHNHTSHVKSCALRQ